MPIYLTLPHESKFLEFAHILTNMVDMNHCIENYANVYGEFISYFEKLPDDKKELVIKQLKTLAGFTNSLCEEIGVEKDLIINKELLDVKKESYSEEDFTEAIIVLINSIQNSLCDFHTKFCDLIEEYDN